MTLILCENGDEAAKLAADMVLREMCMATTERGKFTIALAGGSTPENVYKLLASSPRAAQGDWKRTYLFFGDERMVPPDDERSNYGMAARSLLAGHADVPPEQVYRVPTEGLTPEEAAARYSETLAKFFDAPPSGGPPPVFDLILLGLGDDGHTASLFPQMPALDVADKWATSSPPGVLPPPVDRVTLTFPVLNAARCVVFLVTGERKANVLKRVLEEKPPAHDAPAVAVCPTEGSLHWIVDRAAARLLSFSVG